MKNDLNSNKYSDHKIVWFQDKLNSFRDNIVLPPIYVRVKPINRCIHNCFFCVYNSDFSGLHETMNKIDMISKEKMFEILDDFKDMGVKAITYSGGGEPLLHPDIVDILRRTKENNIDLSVITNGQLLKGKIAEEFYDSKWVRISMDYHTPQMLKETRRVSEKFFDVIINNIKNFSENKDENCNITVNYIITKHNYRTIYEACQLMKELNIDNIRISPMWITNFMEYHSEIKDEVIENINKARRELQTEKFIVYDSYKIIEDVINRKYTKCFVQQTIPVVGADLNVYNCHNKAYSGDGIIGSIKDTTFKEMWFSDKTKKHFETFNPMIHCNHQCANDKKNIFIHDLINNFGDNFV